MSNLESAKAALDAELSQARQGVAYYQSRIEALTAALAQLDTLLGGTGKMAAKPGPKGKRGRKPGKAATKAAAGKRGPKKAPAAKAGKRASASGDNLPFTGGDFWPNLVTSEPQSGADILHAAIANLGFTPTKQQVTKLTNRLTFALHALVKSGKIQDSGSGRERRFFKA